MARNKKQGDKFNAPFATSLRQLIEERHATQGDIALITGVTRQTVSQYCNGISEPGYDTLVKIADYFNVSIDSLLGNAEDLAPNPSAVDAQVLSKKGQPQNGKTIEDFVEYLKSMQQVHKRGTLTYVCDFQVCVGIDELNQTLRTINDSRWSVISVTQFEEEYTVFFVRSEWALV